jgi:tRNA-splicing ligase RtcB
MNNKTNYTVIPLKDGVPIKIWTGRDTKIQTEPEAMRQLYNMAKLPFIYKWLAVMPDVHVGQGACIGSVIPTKGAVMPAAVGVDIGCGMRAVRTDIMKDELPENLKPMRLAIEKAVPHGRSHHGGSRDKGAWGNVPTRVNNMWNAHLETEFREICKKHKYIADSNNLRHLGTLGSGNHFIEVCFDTEDRVWIMLHSGSRGVGGRIGGFFLKKAKKEAKKMFIDRFVADKNLSYLVEGTEIFDDFLQCCGWAQRFAFINRQIMMENTIKAMGAVLHKDLFTNARKPEVSVDCHHNYVEKENHYGENVWVTRKGAVRVREGELGIIPGSMGSRSYIVEGKGVPESFYSCSHGAGRLMSRTKAKEKFDLQDHLEAMEGVECRLEEDTIDETPMAYKNIDDVMEAQSDLVEIKHTLKQVICVKG